MKQLGEGAGLWMWAFVCICVEILINSLKFLFVDV